MSDIIQCPQCNKKFRLPAKVPPTFTCSGCGTLMDLSDFSGAVEPAPAPPPPRAGADASPGGPPRSRRSRRRGRGRGAPSRGAAAPAPGRAAGPRRSRGRARAAPVDDGYDDEDVGYRGRRRKSNTPLIVGSIAAFVAAVVIVVVVMQKKGDGGGGQDGGSKVASGAGGKTPPAPGTIGSATEPRGPGTPGQPGGSDPTAGDDEDPDVSPIKKPKPGARIRLSKVELKRFDWPPEVDQATRDKVEEAILGLYRGGRDGIDGKDYLVSQGRPICGRLISEFKAIEENPGLESRDGRSKLGCIDGVLREIDGWIERRWKEKQRIKPHSTAAFVKGMLQRWTYWWETEEWKKEPRKPWDPFEDESDETEDGRKPPEDDPPEKPEGFQKPAGR